jgi:hypothetical protein
MDGIRSGYSAKTADPSPSLRFGRDRITGAKDIGYCLCFESPPDYRIFIIAAEAKAISRGLSCRIIGFCI